MSKKDIKYNTFVNRNIKKEITPKNVQIVENLDPSGIFGKYIFDYETDNFIEFVETLKPKVLSKIPNKNVKIHFNLCAKFQKDPDLIKESFVSTKFKQLHIENNRSDFYYSQMAHLKTL